MARVTVEDCVNKVRDRFELVAIASQRAKNVAAGEPLTIERNNEKNTVLALREIAGGTVSVADLHEALIKSYQKEREIEEDLPEEDRNSLSDEALSAVLAEDEERAVQDIQLEEEELAEPFGEEIIEESAIEEVAEEEENAKVARAKIFSKKDFSFEEDNIDVDD